VPRYVSKTSSFREEQPTAIHDVAALSVRATKKPFVLAQVQGPGSPREFVLELDEIVLGRSLQANITVDGGGVSRQHMALRRNGPEYTARDLESANGMFLNGVKTHSAVLREGDVLQIGDLIFVYHEGT
jgi:pSer/pThr/pTyr-binding forkhead associated (FHA) protein